MNLVSRLLLLIFTLSSGIALADNATLFKPTVPENGFYVGADIGGGSSKCNDCNINKITNTYSSTSNSNIIIGIIDAFGGYRINPYIAIEAGIGRLPSTSIESTYLDPDTHLSTTQSRTTSTQHAYLALKGTIPLNDQFDLFGKVGFDAEQLIYTQFHYNVDDDCEGNNACKNGNSVYSNAAGTYLAVGASYHITPHWNGTVSYNRVLTSNGDSKFDSSYAALGFTYIIF